MYSIKFKIDHIKLYFFRDAYIDSKTIKKQGNDY